MFSFFRKNLASKIVGRAHLQAISMVVPIRKKYPEITSWLREEEDVNNWKMFAAVAVSFISLATRSPLNNKNKLFYAVIAKLNEEIPEAERFMDDLTNFVSTENATSDSITAMTGYWLVLNVKINDLTKEEKELAVQVGRMMSALSV